MANTLQTIRGKVVPSKRVLFAVGGAAAIALGVMQTADTMAASTDAANAKATQISSQNFNPVPVPTSMSCSNTGNPSFGGDANLSWTNMGPGYKYRIEQWRDNTSRDYVEDRTSNTYPAYSTGRTNYSFRLRVRTISIATGEVSSGYVSWSLHSPVANSAGCSSSFGQENVTSWQETSAWDPGTPANVSEASGADAPAARKALAPSASESATPTTKPSSSETSAPETSTPQPSTPESSQSSTSKPSPIEPSAPESSTPTPEPKITVSIGVAGEAAGFTIYKDGVESCNADKAPEDKVNVGGNQVTITTADGAVLKVDPNTCALS